jgi:hypothetical protein
MLTLTLMSWLVLEQVSTADDTEVQQYKVTVTTNAEVTTISISSIGYILIVIVYSFAC